MVALIWWAWLGSTAWAKQIVEGSAPATVKVSARDLNRITAPAPILKVYTSKAIDVKIDRSEAFIKIPPDTPDAIELYLVTEEKTYTLMLIPLPIPAQTIRISGVREAGLSSKERSLPYVEEIKELFRAAVSGETPPGYESTPLPEGSDLCPYVECSLIPLQQIAGSHLKAVIYFLKNPTSKLQAYQEESFSGKGIKAVSLERHQLEPGGSTRLFRVEVIP
jgi:hypothetical protein